jgi:hypothetical protein
LQHDGDGNDEALADESIGGVAGDILKQEMSVSPWKGLFVVSGKALAVARNGKRGDESAGVLAANAAADL